MTSTPKKKKPPDIPLVVPTIRARLCFLLCSNCADTYGFNLPCSALGLLELGGYSTAVSFQWLFRSLRTRSPPLNPESVVGCGGLASFGCRRSSFPATVPFVRFRGSRSVVIKNSAQGWQTRSLAPFTGPASLVLTDKLGVQTRPSSVHSLEFPHGNWVEAVCRFYSVIIPGTGVDIQRGGIEIGLALCALQCKQFQTFSLGTLVVPNFPDVGLAQQVLASLRSVKPRQWVFHDLDQHPFYSTISLVVDCIVSLVAVSFNMGLFLEPSKNGILMQVFEQAIVHSTNGQKTHLRQPAELLKPAVA